MDVCVCVCACASPVAGDTVDHAHADWHCSTAEITNHYYAAEDEEHLRPSPTHRRLRTLSIPQWRSDRGTFQHIYFLRFGIFAFTGTVLRRKERLDIAK